LTDERLEELIRLFASASLDDDLVAELAAGFRDACQRFLELEHSRTVAQCAFPGPESSKA